MIRRACLILGLCLAAAAATAQSDPVIVAKRAAAQLAAAEAALRAAETARDRVAALTRTVRAYEEGLTGLRESLRRAAIREAALARAFAVERHRISRLLGVLQSIGAAPAPVLLLHPSGPLGTARSGMIVADVTPALQREADRLRAELEEIATLRALQDSAAGILEEGLVGAQAARTALSQAISNRTDLPRRYLSDPEALAQLAESAATLESFALGLGGTVTETGVAAPRFTAPAGDLPLPVAGTLLRRPGEADAAGIRRPGLVIATAPRALVTVPLAATVRYRGPLLDYGNVMVLEPGDGYLLVLAGLDRLYGDPGDILPAGTPVGLMGGEVPDAAETLLSVAEGGVEDRSETLYMELRQGETPIDPGAWFALD